MTPSLQSLFWAVHVALSCHAASTSAAPTSTASEASSTAVPSAVLQSCAASMDGKLPYPTPLGYEFSGNVRRFYVAAEEVEWDYVPSGWDNWLGVPIEESPRAQAAGALEHGTKWLKALYRGYTSGSFDEYSEQPAWQGTQGPTLRAEVNDLIEIMFVNKLDSYYATMHSMGLAYTKTGEGADYPNNTQPGQNVNLPVSDAVPPLDAGVNPGDCVVYKWMVQPAAGPPPGEPARTHSYHSYVDLQSDSNAGLIGPTIVYAQGKMQSTMASYREFPLLYMIYDESNSWLSGANSARLTSNSSRRSVQGDGHGPAGHHSPSPDSAGPWRDQHGSGSVSIPANASTTTATPLDTVSVAASIPAMPSGNVIGGGNYSVYHPQLVNLGGSNQFQDAPSYHTMNGYIFANNPPYEMCLNDNAIWYVNAYGAASHVFHMHGNGFSYDGVDRYAISLNDGVGKTLYMPAADPGIWQVICHVSNHHAKGMVNNYRIYYEGQCPLTPLGS